MLRHGDVVVLHVDHLHILADLRITVDEVRNRTDKGDNLLGHKVAGGRLGSEDIGVRDPACVRIGLNGAVPHEDAQGVHILPLVLVQALDLYVKDGGGLHLNFCIFIDQRRQILLILELDLTNAVEHGLVIRKFLQIFQLIQIVHKFVPDQLRDQRGQARIGLAEPAARGDAVGDIGEFHGREAVEIAEHGLFEDFAVQGGHTIDMVAGRHTEVRHADDSAGDDGRVFHNAGIVRGPPDEGAQAVVDLPRDLIHTRQQTLEQVLRPALKRLAHDRVVGVRHGIGDNAPCVIPAVSAVVKQDAHQLRNSQRGMRVIDMDGRFIGEVIHGRIVVQVAVNNILHGGGHQEVLLAQAQALALRVVVIRIEHLADNLRHGIALHGAHVVALIEEVHIQPRRAGLPQTQDAHALTALTRDIHVIRHSRDGRIPLVLHVVIGPIPRLIDIALKMDFNTLLLMRNEPDLTARQPEIGQLRLPAVNELLAEKSVLVQDAVAGGLIAAVRKGVQIAGGQTAQPTVAQARVRFALIERIKLDPVFGECSLHRLCTAEIIQIVLQGPAHEELHAQVIDFFTAGGLGGLCLKILTLLLENVAQHHGRRLIKLLICRLYGRYPKIVGKFIDDVFIRLF